MDRIEKALQKTKNGEDMGFVSSHAEDFPGLKIDYKHTKRIEVPREKLIENGLYVLLEGKLLEDMRILRSVLLEKLEPFGGKVVMFTSANPGEGKTFVASNLAVCMAMEFDKTSLLVDANLRRPAVADVFGIGEQVEATFVDVLLGRADVKDALYNPGIDRLVVMPARKTGASAELLGLKRTKMLFEELKRRYPERYIIVDAPDTLGCSDPIVLAEMVDAVVLVVEAYRTRKSEIVKRRKSICRTLSGRF